MPADSAEHIATALTASLLAGEFTRAEVLRRTEEMLGPLSRRAQRSLVRQLFLKLPASYPPSPEWLKAFFLQELAYTRAIKRVAQRPDYVHQVLTPARFAPIAKFADLDIPRLPTVGDLAVWLRVELNDLDWFADQKRQHDRTRIPVLQNYNYALIPKRNGDLRLIEQPKPRLKTIQRRILHGILDHVPVHDRAFGFVSGRSCIDGAMEHAGHAVVASCDISNFFPTTRASRIHALFRSLGYPWAVARLLTGLVTTTTPRSVLKRLPHTQRFSAEHIYLRPHLAQGAPTSPALANLCAWRLDCRLTGLAASFNVTYTRYADDMTFSGGALLGARADALLRAVTEIVSDEGWFLNTKKTRIMRPHVRQQVTGIVINKRLNVPRAEFDLLKATLHNAVRLGWHSQDRAGHPDFRAHLDGRIRWVERLNQLRGEKLRHLFAQIDWTA